MDNHRRRLRERGLLRVEVRATEADALLIRRVAKALEGAPQDAAKLREQLYRFVASEAKPGLKALLAAAPLEGIEISRPRDKGRPVDL